MNRAVVIALIFGAVSASAQSLEHAKALEKAQDYDGANNEFKALVAANPKNAEYRVAWGDLFAECFNLAEAQNLYKEALGIDPKNADATLGMARLAAESFDGKASDLAEEALSYNPKLYQAHELIAKIALEDDNPKKATEHADAALAINQDAVEAIAIKASIDLLADKDSPWVAKIGNRGEGYATIAHFYDINRRYEECIAYYRKAIAATPNLWSAHSELGISLMRMGRDDEAFKELTAAYNNSYDDGVKVWQHSGKAYRDAATANSLTLIDSYKNFETFRTPTTVLRLNKKESAVLLPYFQDELNKIIATYSKKYQYQLPGVAQVEVYPDHTDFEVRTAGMPGLGGILGVTFNSVVAMDSPSSRTPGEFHWASTLWHEMSHMYVLNMTHDLVPRWFTEGLSVHEETQASPDWGDRVTPDILAAVRDKKLLSVADIDRGFVHPTYEGQVIVSYYEAGKILDFIDQKWGDSKIVDMIHEFAQNKPTVEVIKDQLGMDPATFDKEFLAMIDHETASIIAGFSDWTKGVRELADLTKSGKWDDVIARGRQIEKIYPDYVEKANVYEFVSDACLKKGDKACAIDELGRYNKVGGRDPETIKQYAQLLVEAGRQKDAAAALERLNYIYPVDPVLHERLGGLLLQLGDAKGAIREYQALVALKPLDVAGSHYNLAKAYQANGQKDQAREEAFTALEAAPDYKPAQKLLLEVQ